VRSDHLEIRACTNANCRSLGFPGFPVDLVGVDGLHAVFSYGKPHTRLCPVQRGRKSGGSPHFSFPVSRWSNPCTRRSANIGHPPRGQGLVGSRKSGGRNKLPNRAKVVLFSFNSPSASQLLGMTNLRAALHLCSDGGWMDRANQRADPAVSFPVLTQTLQG
jgi:hypothetical protein